MWDTEGGCKYAAKCKYKHEGFALKDAKGELVGRCVTCGGTGHVHKECAQPGGRKDPDRVTNLQKAAKDIPFKGKGEGGGPRPSARAGRWNQRRLPFPAGAAGWDTWANVWLRHLDDDEGPPLREEIILADGTKGRCRTEKGSKGIPTAYVRSTQDSIDLLPGSWLIERGCDVNMGPDTVLTDFHI